MRIYLTLYLLIWATVAVAQEPYVRIEMKTVPGSKFCLTVVVRPITIYPVATYAWFRGRRTAGLLAPSPADELLATTEILSLTLPADATGGAETGVGGIYLRITTPDGKVAFSDTAVGAGITLDDRPLITAPRNVLCPGEPVPLSVDYKDDKQPFWWELDGVPVGGIGRTLRATEAGTYRAIAFDSIGCVYRSILFRLNPAPVGQTTLSGPPELCLGETTSLSVVPAVTARYDWLRDDKPITAPNQPILAVREAGRYQARLTDANQCTALTNSVAVTLAQPITVAMNPVGSFCSADARPVPLTATPAGGIYAGAGVQDGSFTPKKAGPGTHPITYSISKASACQSGTAQQTVTVQASPQVELPDILYIRVGESVRLLGPAGPDLTYAWTPPATLSTPLAQSTMATPLLPTVYTLRVRSVAGCYGQDSVRVIPDYPVYIPTAFTPNQDGVNDVWTLVGIENYPQAEVVIYDRWGSVIFSSVGYQKAFGEAREEQTLSVGAYTYRIRLWPERPPLSGRFILIR